MVSGVELTQLSLDLHYKASQLEQDCNDLQALTLSLQLRLLADEVSDYGKEKRQAEVYRNEPRKGVAS